MYHFLLSLIALLIQVYSIHTIRNNNDKEARYSFWYGVLSVIIGLASFYFHFTSYFASIKAGI